MNFLLFPASHRIDSYNRKLVKLAETQLISQSHKIDFAEYNEFDMPLYNDMQAGEGEWPAESALFATRARRADGIIIASPEYNWSYPGSLKNIIDWTSRLKPNPVAGKKVLLLSATQGKRGGVDCLQHLKAPLAAIKLIVFEETFSLARCDMAFDSSDQLQDAEARGKLAGIITRFVEFTGKPQ